MAWDDDAYYETELEIPSGRPTPIFERLFL
jgi:hypothetical protein